MANNVKRYSIKNCIIILADLMAANKFNRVKGIKDNISLCITGPHGIGKSETVKAYGAKNKYATEVIEVAQLDEVTYLTGYPRQTYKFSKNFTKTLSKPDVDGNTTKVETEVKEVRDVLVAEVAAYLKDGWKQETFLPELTYSRPSWVNRLYKTSESLLFLDEVNRGLPFIQNAIMNIINNGGYNTWKLPPGCTVVLAKNPSDTGNYNVSGFDDASSDRYFDVYAQFDKEGWAEWASGSAIPEACINFILKVPEATDYNNKDRKSPSIRMWTRFFRSIAHLDLRNKDNYEVLMRNGVASIGQDMTVNFQNFIDNNLDIIPSLEWCFDKKNHTNNVMSVLKSCIYDKNTNQIRSDIKGLIAMRLKTFIRSRKSTEVNIDFINRILQLVKQSILPKDTIILLIMDILKKDHPHKKKMKENFMLHDDIMDVITKSKATLV